MSARHWSDGWTRDHLIDEIERLRSALREIRDYTPIEDIAARNIARRALEGK